MLNKRHFFNTLLFIFAALLPTQFGKHFFLSFSFLSGVRTDYLAPTIYVTDILTALLLLFYIPSYKKLLRNPFVQLLFFLCSVNLLFAYSKEITLYRYIKLIELYALISVMKNVFNKNYVLFFYGIFTGTVVEFIIALGQLILKQSLQGPFYFLGERVLTLSAPGIAKASLDSHEFLRPYATFSHPNSLGGFYVVLYALFLIKPKNIHWLFHTLFLFFTSALIILSFSKNAIMAWFFINVFVLLARRKNYTFCLPCFISRVLLIFVPLLLLFFTTTSNQSLPLRMQLIQNSLAIIKHHWFTGVGLGNYLFAQQRFATNQPYFFAQPVHDIYLLLISELGIGISAYIFFWIIKFVVKGKNNAPFILSLFAILFTGLFDHYWLTLQQNFLLLGVIGGFYLSITSAF